MGALQMARDEQLLRKVREDCEEPAFKNGSKTTSPELENNNLGDEVLTDLNLAMREILRYRKLRRGRVENYSSGIAVLLLEQLRSFTRSRNVSLYLVKENRLTPKFAFGDWEADHGKPRVFEFGQGIAGMVLKTKEPYVSKGNVQDDPLFDLSENPRSQKVRSLLCVPIFDFDGEVIGVINLDSYKEDWFGQRLRRRISNLQPRVYDALKELGMPDAVTNDELIAINIWVFQKAISHDYIFFRGETDVSERDEPIEERVLLDPERVDEVFRAIHEELAPGEGKPGPRPVRLERIWEVFRGRENEKVSLDDFESAFGSRKSAASALSWLNNTFRRWKYDLEIETIHCTEYRLRQRQPSDS